ncbi:MAG: ABC transporter ATP-binding protein/permease [Alphaproteobacteria bacterium]|nr:ABC transporter ATP-binding protein/permease [Alphaproteobacteria bacterium]
MTGPQPPFYREDEHRNPGLRRGRSFTTRFIALAIPHWQRDSSAAGAGIVTLLILLSVVQVGLAVWTNYWSALFFDAIESREPIEVIRQSGIFLLIMVATILVTGAHLHVKRDVQFRWRRWLTERLLDEWLRDGRHYQLEHLPGDHGNPDGRIAEDIRNLTEVAIELAHSFLYCALMLVSFVSILWTLSGAMTARIGDTSLDIPGHMVWVALLYAGVGSTLAYLLGKPIVVATNLRQTQEAEFRFGLARAVEYSEAIAVLRGEPDERRHLSRLFDDIRLAWQQQTLGLRRLLYFSSGYASLATVFPLLVSAPRYIVGAITLGGLMQTAQAFQQVIQSLSWIVDNSARVAEWRASVERVLSLDEAVFRLRRQAGAQAAAGILRQSAGEPVLRFVNLTIRSPEGHPILKNFEATVSQGERVLITGNLDAATKLFKATAGLWPWGEGSIELPARTEIFLLPQRPYLPVDRLRSVLAYPATDESFDSEILRNALERVGLPDLSRRLDDTENWSRILTEEEQQRLAFARLLAHRPHWVFLQDATDTLEEAEQEKLLRLVVDEFSDATLITIARHAGAEALHGRKIELPNHRHVGADGAWTATT